MCMLCPAHLEHDDIVGLQVRLDRLSVAHLPVQVDDEAPGAFLVPLDPARPHLGHHGRAPVIRERSTISLLLLFLQ